jgi:hypothetical protein
MRFMKTLTKATTAREAIDAMGGASRFAAWWGARCGVVINPRRVTDWAIRGFPRSSFIALSKALRRAGIDAQPSAWNLETRPVMVTRNSSDEARP